MTEAADPGNVWVLADPRAGTAAQALGIAERLGVPFRTVPLAWGRLAALPWPFPTLLGLTPEACRQIIPPWPRLVISAGRRAAPVALWLGRHGAQTVHCMRPGFGAGRFGLLVVGRHDAPEPADNLMPILGAAHRMSPAKLAAARLEWEPALHGLPGPRIALLVGGRVRGEGLDLETARALVPALRRRFPGCTILASTSRRTGTEASAAIAAALEGTPHVLYRWGDTGPNPYAGFLAWADAIAVTGDSVSMLSEACGTGVPVLVAGREAGRHAALAESLYAAGLARPLLSGEEVPAPSVLDESGRVAARIREMGCV
jgi:mitochondrial fission protein ELM1